MLCLFVNCVLYVCCDVVAMRGAFAFLLLILCFPWCDFMVEGVFLLIWVFLLKLVFSIVFGFLFGFVVLVLFGFCLVLLCLVWCWVCLVW